eukprot:COSAG02_NODE_11601_length_1691_cov_1.256910_1_plen_548_part_01
MRPGSLEELLLGQGPLLKYAQPQRPSIMSRSARQIFLERPKARRLRAKDGDKWLNSGGKVGGMVHWIDSSNGIRKRYVRVVPQDGTESQVGAEYFRVAGNDEHQNADLSSVAFVVEPQGITSRVRRDKQQFEGKGGEISSDSDEGERGMKASALTAGSSVAASSASILRPTSLDACVQVKASRRQSKFISFLGDRAGARGSSVEIELGAVVKQGRGVVLKSRQGDFAEWHRRQAEEPPLDEGDVVGFHAAGEISRKTTGATMLGVVSRSAVVEGSAPPQDERHLFDTVAHVGVVPVKVLRPKVTIGCETSICALQPGPVAGDALVPSGRNDGTAIIMDPTDLVNSSGADTRKIAVVLDSEEWKIKSGTGETQLVSSLVVSPVETQRVGATRKTLRRFWRAVFGLAGLAVLLSLYAILLNTQTPLPSSPNAAGRDSVRCSGNLLQDLIAVSLPGCTNAPEANYTTADWRQSSSCIFHDAALMGLPGLQRLALLRQKDWPSCRCLWSCKLSPSYETCCNAGRIASLGIKHDMCGEEEAPPWPLLRPPTLE